jgi:hypothetical protein
MIKNLKKLFNLNYVSFIGMLTDKGYFRHTTFLKDEETPVISTVIYADGDILSILYQNKYQQLLVEQYPKKLAQHQQFIEERINNLEILKQHITWFAGIVSVLLSFLIPVDDPLTRFGVAGTFGVAGLLLKKFFSKGIFRMLKVFIKLHGKH